MAFVRKKIVKGQTYHYLCESRWEDGSPRQRVIAYLGSYATVKGAHAHWVRQAKAKTTAPADRKHAREMVKTLEQYL